MQPLPWKQNLKARGVLTLTIEARQSMGPLHHRGGHERWEGGKGLRLQWERDSELGLRCLSHRKGGSLKGIDVYLTEYSVNGASSGDSFRFKDTARQLGLRLGVGL